MKWLTKEIDLYIQSKEYVDTAIIPLLPISSSNDIKATVAMGEFCMTIAYELERQFKGRIILFPAFSYSFLEREDARENRLSDWTKEIKEIGLNHIIYLTSDNSWEQFEQSMAGTFIWLPSLPLQHVDDQYKQSIIQNQMKELISVFLKIWQ